MDPIARRGSLGVGAELAGLMVRVIFYEYDSQRKLTTHKEAVSRKLSHGQAVAIARVLSIEIPKEYMAKIMNQERIGRAYPKQLMLDIAAGSDSKSPEGQAAPGSRSGSACPAAETDGEWPGEGGNPC
jgi:hypothetical protein